MNWIENVLIIAGVSLDIFAAMECQGALVAKVDKKQLSVICALIAVWQLCALALGNYLSGLLYRNELAHDENFVGLVIAAVIFFGLGIRLIAKAIKNEWVNERREESLDVKKFLRMTAVTSIYTLLAGIAFGFLGTNVALMLIIIVCMTIAFVVRVYGLSSGISAQDKSICRRSASALDCRHRCDCKTHHVLKRGRVFQIEPETVGELSLVFSDRGAFTRR